MSDPPPTPQTVTPPAPAPAPPPAPAPLPAPPPAPPPADTSRSGDIVLYFVAIILPPVAVFIKRGCGADLLINVFLDILGWFPGVVHSWYIISQTPGRNRW